MKVLILAKIVIFPAKKLDRGRSYIKRKNSIKSAQ